MSIEPAFELLDSLDGIAYVIDADGTIIDYNRDGWDRFAGANDGEELCTKEAIIGRHLLDLVSGEDVRLTYHRLIDLLLNGTRDRVSFNFSCDRPASQRKMRLAITPVRQNHGVSALLFHTILLEERIRPAMDLFDFKARHESGGTNLPLLLMCSYCQEVRFPLGSTPETGEWVTAQKYYQLGGTTEVEISHGICAQCLETRVKPTLMN